MNGMNKEIWKDIEGYEGLYQVSNLGRVRSTTRKQLANIRNNKYITKKGQVLTPMISNAGYGRVTLFKERKRKMYSVHRLVAMAFIDNPDNLPEVNHKDGNKRNNELHNLEWCSKSANVKHAYDNKLTKHYTRKILQYGANGELLKEWDSLISITRELGFNFKTIQTVCAGRGRAKRAFGYVWKYDTREEYL